MTTFYVLTDITSSAFETANPTYDRLLDTLFISEGALVTVDADFGWYELKLGDWNGSATLKYGRITDDGSAHTITSSYRCIPYSVGGALNSINFTGQALVANGHSFIDGYQSGAINCTLNLDGCAVSGTGAAIFCKSATWQTITGNWTINNCDCSITGFRTGTHWDMQGNITITNNVFSRFSYYTTHHRFCPQMSGDFNMSNNTVADYCYMYQMTFTGAFRMINNMFAQPTHTNYPKYYYQNMISSDSLFTTPEAITLTLADGADGALDVTIPSISGNPQPVCELALRVGAAPDFTDYILGRFAESQTISIGAWNNAGTWIKISGGDSVQVLCRCINTVGTTTGTGGTQVVTDSTAAPTYNVTTELTARMSAELYTEYPNE